MEQKALFSLDGENWIDNNGTFTDLTPISMEPKKESYLGLPFLQMPEEEKQQLLRIIKE